jgi:hypothetical protein
MTEPEFLMNRHPLRNPVRVFSFSDYAPSGADSRADNPAKTTVESLWVQN